MKKVVSIALLVIVSLVCLTNYGMQDRKSIDSQAPREYQNIALQSLEHPDLLEDPDFEHPDLAGLNPIFQPLLERARERVRKNRRILKEIFRGICRKEIPKEALTEISRVLPQRVIQKLITEVANEELENEFKSELLQLSIEKVTKEGLIFNTRKNIPEKTITITIKTSPVPDPEVKQLEINFVYNLETKTPSKITITKHSFGKALPPTIFDYPLQKFDINKKKIKELVATIMEHPYVKKILHPELEEQEALAERIEFIKEAQDPKVEKQTITLPETKEKKKIEFFKIFK